MEPSNQTLNDILIRLEKNVDATNGRVRNLELWRARITGAITIVSIAFTGVLIPIIIKIYF